MLRVRFTVASMMALVAVIALAIPSVSAVATSRIARMAMSDLTWPLLGLFLTLTLTAPFVVGYLVLARMEERRRAREVADVSPTPTKDRATPRWLASLARISHRDSSVPQ